MVALFLSSEVDKVVVCRSLCWPLLLALAAVTSSKQCQSVSLKQAESVK